MNIKKIIKSIYLYIKYLFLYPENDYKLYHYFITFTDIKQCMKFIMNYEGNLRIVNSNIYDGDKLVAIYKNKNI